jgi:hypothetical protein
MGSEDLSMRNTRVYRMVASACGAVTLAFLASLPVNTAVVASDDTTWSVRADGPTDSAYPTDGEGGTDGSTAPAPAESGTCTDDTTWSEPAEPGTGTDDTTWSEPTEPGTCTDDTTWSEGGEPSAGPQSLDTTW